MLIMAAVAVVNSEVGCGFLFLELKGFFLFGHYTQRRFCVL